MTEAKLKFVGNKIFCNGFEITQSMYGWHVLNADGELEIDKQVNLIDQFIQSGEFDKAFRDVFGLPIGVVESLGEVS